MSVEALVQDLVHDADDFTAEEWVASAIAAAAMEANAANAAAAPHDRAAGSSSELEAQLSGVLMKLQVRTPCNPPRSTTTHRSPSSRSWFRAS